MRRRLIAQNGGTPAEPYLRVAPTETIWVDKNLSGEYLVLSNTDWTIQ